MARIEASKLEWASLLLLVGAGCELLGEGTAEYVAAGPFDITYARQRLGKLLEDTSGLMHRIGEALDSVDNDQGDAHAQR